MRYALIAFALLAISSGCASTQPVDSTNSSQKKDGVMSSTARVSGEVVSKTSDGFSDAALSPLEDLNLKRKKIPDEIKFYVSPYDPVGDVSCVSLANEIQRLDTVLAKDFDIQIQELIQAEGKKTKPGNISGKASDLALNTIASEARSFIPFRGLVRQATGANAHEKKVDQAFQRAYLRRSYLKGIGAGRNCDFPAAPIPYEMSDVLPKGAPISYRGSSGAPKTD